ncbi:MAG: hypothetical protein NTZ27_01020 [Ignavibacteriales bacterium]|nr:hypothetical protein [Ignavibacteriales bacterium]
MKKILGAFIILMPILSLFAQTIPFEYSFGKNRLSKTSDQTPAGNTIEKILIQDNIIWLATGEGLSKSTDNGDTWTNYNNTIDFGTESVSAIGYSSGTIWAATWHFEDRLGTATPVGAGLRYSQDNGVTWNVVPQPVDKSSDTVEIYGINRIKALPVINSDQNFVRQIALTKNTIWIATSGGGLRKSTDMGRTWKRVVVPPDNLDSIKPTDTLNFSLGPPFGPFGNLNNIGYSILAVDDSTLYFGTYGGGINKSTDGGMSWIKFNHVNETKPISGTQIMDLAYNEFDKSIWAATWKLFGDTEYWGISFSKDGGQTWETTLPDSRTLDFAFKYFGTPGSYTGADVFAATQNGVYRSGNGGSTWITSPNIKDDQTGVGISTTNFLSVKTNRRSDGSTDIWFGTDKGLARLNETNGFWSGKWKVFLAFEKLASTNDTYAFPNPFSPDVEGTKIVYSTSTVDNVTIRIFDFGMNLVKTLIQNAGRGISGEHIAYWDGRDESGKIVPNGVYFYRIDIGSGTPLFGKIMVVM